MLIVSQSGGGQFCLKVNGEYKRTGKAAALPLPGGAAAHDREKEYLLREGENIPAFVDLGVFTQDFKIVRAKYSKYRQINRFVELVDQSFASDGREEISILDFGCGKSYLTFILYYYFSIKKAYAPASSATISRPTLSSAAMRSPRATAMTGCASRSRT